MLNQALAAELHPKVRAFIEKSCGGITSVRRAREVEFELITHIFEIEEELRNAHLSEEQMADEILRRMGDPAELEKQMARANRSPIRKFAFEAFKYLSIVVFGGFLVSAFVFHSRAVDKFKTDRAIIHSRMTDLKESQLSAPLPDFTRPVQSGRDAGTYLNSLVPWHRRNQAEGRLAVSDSLRTSLGTANYFKIAKGDQRIDLEGFDFSWMAKLKDFDYWDFFKNSGGETDPLRDFTDLPDGMTLVDLAKARLVHGLQTNDLERALSDVYHLARLQYSSNISHHALLSLSTLDLLQKTYVKAREMKKVKPLSWINWSESDVKRLQTLTRDTSALIASLASDPSDLQLVIDHPEWAAGVCVGLSESVLNQAVIDPFFRTTWPFEFSTRDRDEGVRTLLARNRERCRLDSVANSNFVTSFTGIQGRLFGHTAYLENMVRFVPYIRRIYGLQLARVLAPAN